MYNTAFGSVSKLKAACVNGIKICHNMQASSDELVQAAPVVPRPCRSNSHAAPRRMSGGSCLGFDKSHDMPKHDKSLK